MMLDVALLRDSDFAAHPNAEVFRSGVLAWCVAFHQVPAASLPDDNAAISRLIGLGRDAGAGDRFAALREQGALHGFVKCGDGRLYHPVVAEKVFIVLENKAKNKTKTAAATEKRKELAALRRAERDGGGNGDRHDNRHDNRHGGNDAHQLNQTKLNRTQGKKEKAAELPLGAAVQKRPVFQIPVWVPVAEWAAFEEMRRSIKKPLTPGICERVVLQLSKFKTMGHDPAAVLDQSTRNSWRDVYPIKPEGKDRGNQKSASSSFGSAAGRVVRQRNPYGLNNSGDEGVGGPSGGGPAQGHRGQNLLPAPADHEA